MIAPVKSGLLVSTALWAALTAMIVAAPIRAAESASQPIRQRGDGPPPPGAIAPMLLEHGRQIAAQLQLTDDQKTKIDAIYTKAKADLQAMRSELESAEPQERMQRVRELFDGIREQVGNVLTPDQKEQFTKKLEEARQNLRNGGGAGATTRPDGGAAGDRAAGDRPGREGRGASAFADRLRDNLQKLDLTDEQKVKVKDLFEDVKTRSEALRMQIETGATDATDKLRKLFQDTRSQLGQILTPEQREKLRDLMGGPGGPGGPGDRRGDPSRQRPGAAGDRATTKSAMKSDMKPDDESMAMDGGKSKDKSKAKKSDASADQTVAPGPAIGEPAPAVALKRLDGSNLQLSSLKGRVVVLEFGSYSCPAFRARVAAMEKLKTDYGTRAQFFVVYTKEAHAVGEWEVDRNKDEGITVEQSKTFDARKALATTAKDKLKVTVPILIDTTANEALSAFGSGMNSAYVIGRDGSVLARQQWFEPNALRRSIDDATKTGPAAGSTVGPTTKPNAEG